MYIVICLVTLLKIEFLGLLNHLIDPKTAMIVKYCKHYAPQGIYIVLVHYYVRKPFTLWICLSVKHCAQYMQD